MVRYPLSQAQIAAGRRLGEELRAARAGQPITQVAAAARISPETLRKIEAGRLPSPAFGTVVQLCEALGVDVHRLARLWLDHLALSLDAQPGSPAGGTEAASNGMPANGHGAMLATTADADRAHRARHGTVEVSST